MEPISGNTVPQLEISLPREYNYLKNLAPYISFSSSCFTKFNGMTTAFFSATSKGDTK